MKHFQSADGLTEFFVIFFRYHQLAPKANWALPSRALGSTHIASLGWALFAVKVIVDHNKPKWLHFEFRGLIYFSEKRLDQTKKLWCQVVAKFQYPWPQKGQKSWIRREKSEKIQLTKPGCAKMISLVLHEVKKYVFL